MSSKSILFAVFFLAASAAFGQATTGTISGSVRDATNNRAIPGVIISIDQQTDGRNVTNGDGTFTIAVAPGKHTVKFTTEGYKAMEVSDVTVTVGQITDASAALTLETLVTSVDVVEKVDAVSSTAEVMLNERKLSAVVQDSVSRQELSEGTAGTAAAALEKVTGVSVGGEGYVFVRGLNERYSATSLNGSTIPTTEPEKRVVPLDLFPTGMIDNIIVAKTYQPDLPAEFSGGLVQLKTIEFPGKHLLNVSMKGGFNSATTFNPFLSFPGGSGDYWGFGGESRAIPSVIGPDRRLVQGTYTAAELQNFGRSFSDIWEPVKTGSQRPALDWSASGGTSWGKFGIVGALSFSNKPQFRKEQLRYFRLSGGQPLVFSDYPQYDEYGESARMGAVMNFAYRATPNDKIVFRNTWTHDADKTAREFSGLDGATGNETLAQRLRFVERNVLANGVEGEHARPEWANSLIHWQFTYSTSGRNEPDLREVIRARDSDGTYPFVSLTNSGQRFFSDMADRIFEPQFDYSVPFFKGSVTGVFKVGFRGTFRSRDFQARRFRYQPQGALNLLLPGNQLLGDANIRPDGFEIREITRRTDRYEATMDVYAGYAMVDLNFGAKWRVSGGIRIEDATQEVITEDPLIPGAGASTAFLQNRDPAPTVNVVYSLAANQNVRVSYSRTLSRPDFRELSPFDFNNVQGGFVAVGNPNLKRAAIQNFDARWEMFPGGSQLIAASVFAKLFDQPIEQTILASTDLRQSFINAKGAKNYGFELEYRQNLLRFHPGLRDWAISSNLTFVDSNIEIRPEDATVLTSQQRPLLGQSRWVYNGALQWGHAAWNSNAQLSANYVGKRITDVGSFGLPDISQEATTVLDFMFQYKPGENSKWSYRFEAENLTDNDYRWKQGGFLQRQYQLGRTFQIGVNYSFF